MKNLVTNWVFTLIETVLLAVFAVLMLVCGNEVLNILVGIAFIVYIILVVFGKVIEYRGVIQMISVLEFFVVTILAVFVIFEVMPSFSVAQSVNIIVGVSMWFRAMTEILHSYHGQVNPQKSKRNFTGWKVFFYILLLTLGTYISAKQPFTDKTIQYFVFAVVVAAMVIMGVLTFTNYRDYRELHPKPVKVKKEKPEEQIDDSEQKALPDAQKKLTEAEKKPEKAEKNPVDKGNTTQALPPKSTENNEEYIEPDKE